MTPYSGLLLFYLLVLLLLPAVILGLWGKPLKIYGLIFSVLMLAIVFGEGGQLPALTAFYLWEAALFLLFRHRPGQGNLAILAGPYAGQGLSAYFLLYVRLHPIPLFQLCREKQR